MFRFLTKFSLFLLLLSCTASPLYGMNRGTSPLFSGRRALVSLAVSAAAVGMYLLYDSWNSTTPTIDTIEIESPDGENVVVPARIRLRTGSRGIVEMSSQEAAVFPNLYQELIGYAQRTRRLEGYPLFNIDVKRHDLEACLTLFQNLEAPGIEDKVNAVSFQQLSGVLHAARQLGVYEFVVDSLSNKKVTVTLSEDETVEAPPLIKITLTKNEPNKDVFLPFNFALKFPYFQTMLDDYCSVLKYSKTKRSKQNKEDGIQEDETDNDDAVFGLLSALSMPLTVEHLQVITTFLTHLDSEAGPQEYINRNRLYTQKLCNLVQAAEFLGLVDELETYGCFYLLALFSGSEHARTGIAALSPYMQRLINDKLLLPSMHWKLPLVTEELTLKPFENTKYTRNTVYSPDGAYVAVSNDCSIRIIDVRNGYTYSKLLQGHTKPIQVLAWSPCYNKLASGSEDGTIRIWDIEKGSCEQVLEHSSRSVIALDWLRTPGFLVSGSDGSVSIWNITSGEATEIYNGVMPMLCCSPDGKYLAIGSLEQVVIFKFNWSSSQHRAVITAELVTTIERGSRVRSFDWAPWNNLLAVGVGSQIEVWDIRNQNIVTTLEHGNIAEIESLQWARNGSSIVARVQNKDLDNNATLYNMYKWRYQSDRDVLRGSEIPCFARSFDVSPDSKRLLLGGDTHPMDIWNIESDELERSLSFWSTTGDTLLDLVGPVSCCIPNAKTVVVGSRDAEHTFIIDMITNAITQIDFGNVTAMASSDDGDYVIIGSSNGMLRSVNVQTKEVVSEHQGIGAVRDIACSQDGRLAVAHGTGVYLCFVHQVTQGIYYVLENGQVQSVDWLPSTQFEEKNRLLVSYAGADYFDVTEFGDTITNHGRVEVADARLVKYSPLIWPQIASVSDDGIIRIWNCNSYALQHELQGGHAGQINDICWQQPRQNNGHLIRYLASCSQDGSVCIWNTRSGELLHKFDHPRGTPATSVAWSPDGFFVVVGYQGGDIRTFKPDGSAIFKLKDLDTLSCSVARKIIMGEDLTRLEIEHNKTYKIGDFVVELMRS